MASTTQVMNNIYRFKGDLIRVKDQNSLGQYRDLETGILADIIPKEDRILFIVNGRPLEIFPEDIVDATVYPHSFVIQYRQSRLIVEVV